MENTEFDYPELSVVPKASEQVLSESIRNRDSAFRKHWPILVPATTTFLAGALELIGGTEADSDPNNADSMAKAGPWIGMGVGAVWWVSVLGLVEPSDYHSDAVEEIKSLPTKTTRDQLLRERKAEEAISKAGSLARKLKWISLGTNFISGMMIWVTSKSDSIGKYAGISASVLSITPLLFTHRWDDLDQRQQDYKKRIYAPVAGITLLKEPGLTTSLSPGLSLSLAF